MQYDCLMDKWEEPKVTSVSLGCALHAGGHCSSLAHAQTGRRHQPDEAIQFNQMTKGHSCRYSYMVPLKTKLYSELLIYIGTLTALISTTTIGGLGGDLAVVCRASVSPSRMRYARMAIIIIITNSPPSPRSNGV